MADHTGLFERILQWLRAGYPDGVPQHDYVALLGRGPSWHGRHPAFGTRNVLFRLANTYVELLAPDVPGGPLADVVVDLGIVDKDVLLLWGEKNPRVPLAQAYEFRKLLVNSPSVQLEVLPGVGHMAVQEAPEQTARIVRRWLDARP